MIDSNKKLSIILIIACVVMILIMAYLEFLVGRHEDARNYFDISEIEDITWYSKDPEIEFRVENGRGKLIIDKETIVDNDRINLNRQTGEFKINGKSNGVLYLRSVGESNIVIWYQKAEYRLDKKVVNR